MIFGKWVELEGRAWHGFLYLLLWVVGLEFSKIITKRKKPERLAWFLVLCRREGGGRGRLCGRLIISGIMKKDKKPKRLAWFLVLCTRERGMC